MNLNIEEIRRINLINILNSHEISNARDISEIVECEPSYLSQIKTSKKNMGSRFARQMEHSLGLMSGWMDTLHSMDFREKLLYKMFIMDIKSKHIVEYTGAGKGSVSQWVNGNSKPGNKFLPKLSDLLKCSSVWLMDDSLAVDENIAKVKNNDLNAKDEMNTSEIRNQNNLLVEQDQITEITAMDLMNKCLSKLSKEEISRVLAWANSKFTI